MYSGEKYLVLDGGIYIAIQVTSIGAILKITQSLKSCWDMTVMSNSDTIFLNTATPPLGERDSMGFDRPIRIKSSGHLFRMLRCDSVIVTTSNSLISVRIKSA